MYKGVIHKLRNAVRGGGGGQPWHHAMMNMVSIMVYYVLRRGGGGQNMFKMAYVINEQPQNWIKTNWAW